jgi:hypothetical protein
MPVLCILFQNILFFNQSINMRQITNFSTILMFVLCANTFLSAQGTFTSLATGNWNAAGSWTLSSGSDADGIPDSDDNVTITTHTITLDADAACNNITLQGTSGTRLAIVTYTVTVSGTLSGSTTSPSTSLITNTTGKLSFVGASRALFAASPNWGGNTQNWRCEVALNTGETGTSSTAVKMGDLIVTSGTFDAANDIRIDKGADNLGTIAVASGAKILARGWCGSRTGTASTFCASVTVDAGGELEMRGNNLNGNTITINGVLRRTTSTLALGSNPTGIGVSDFTFGSSSEVIYEAGTGSGTFQMGLEIDRNNSTTLITIPNKITVNVGSSNRLSVNNRSATCGTLDLQSGIIYTGTSGRLATSTFLGGNSTNFVCTCTTSGGASTSAIPLIILSVGATPTTYHVGPLPTAYNPAIITNNGTVDGISVRVQTTLTSPVGTTYVNREWNITESVPGGTIADIELQWIGAEEAVGFDRNACYISHYSTVWRQENLAASATGSNPYTRKLTGYTDGFSPFAVASSGALPIEIRSFSGKAMTNTNILQWETASEINVKSHNLERSVDNVSWTTVGTIGSKGSNASYELEDRAPLAKAYYRLRSVDFDGQEQLSKVIQLSRKDRSFGVTGVFPNPTSGDASVQFAATSESTVVLRITDLTGHVVLEQQFDATEGNNQQTVAMSRLQAGTYLVTVIADGQASEPTRVVKQ